VDVWLGGHSHNVIDDHVNGHPVLIAGALGITPPVGDDG